MRSKQYWIANYGKGNRLEKRVFQNHKFKIKATAINEINEFLFILI